MFFFLRSRECCFGEFADSFLMASNTVMFLQLENIVRNRIFQDIRWFKRKFTLRIIDHDDCNF